MFIVYYDMNQFELGVEWLMYPFLFGGDDFSETKLNKETLGH